MKNLTLVIMAAGMGSRYGGLKQIEPVGPNGEIIADYSVYDAIRAGFSKVVFIIRKENLEYFKNHICNKFSDKIKVEYALQELDMIPDDVTLPEGREKMLGTGHALYCAANLIEGDFVVINADDFYGFDSYKIAANFLLNNHIANECLSVNYPFIVTASKNGTVKRGIVVTESGYFKDSVECEVSKVEGGYLAKPLNGNPEFIISEDQSVSVNFFGLRKCFFKILDKEFNKFIHETVDLKNELLLPDVIRAGMKSGDIKVKAALSTSKWMGITYKEDLKDLQENINELIKKGEYPDKLWD